MQAECVGDLAQHQRAQRHCAVREERALPIDDCLRHAKDRLEALLQVLDQPSRLLQLSGEARGGAAIELEHCA